MAAGPGGARGPEHVRGGDDEQWGPFDRDDARRNGIWQGTWKPASASGGVTLFVTALGPNGVGGQNKVSGAVSAAAPAGPTPRVSARGWCRRPASRAECRSRREG